MPGDINLEVVADIAKAKAGLAELTASVNAMQKATGQTAQSAGALQKQFEAAGKSLLHIGKGGVVLAGLASIRTIIQWTKEWNSSLLEVGKTQRETQLGMLSLAQAMPKKLGAGDAAEAARSLMARGARRGLAPQDTEKLLAATFSKKKGAGLAETMAAGEAAIDLVASGVAPEEAAKQARGGPRRQEALARAGARQAALLSRDPYLAQAQESQVAKTMTGYERMFPGTKAGQETLITALAETTRKSVEERSALRSGYLPKEGEGFSGWQEAKQTIGGGRLGEGGLRGWGADLDVVKDELKAARELGAAARNMGRLFDEGSR